MRQVSATFVNERGPKPVSFPTPTSGFRPAIFQPVITDGNGPIRVWSDAPVSSAGTTSMNIYASAVFAGSVAVDIVDLSIGSAVPGVITAPAIASLSIDRGNIGDVITITGSGFTGATAFDFNGVAALAFSVSSDSTMTATVPGNFKNGPVHVVNPAGTGIGPTFYALISKYVDLVPAAGGLSLVIYIGDMADIEMVEDAVDLSAVYVFEYSLDGVTNWFAPVTASTIHDTEEALWKIEGGVSSPPVGKVQFDISEAPYFRLRTTDYTGGTLRVYVQGRPLV